ncbi:uncharacterized protein LOC129747117 [Uranotaenia lowii]|uniref:uncharacterized protein LOC129747117 n=1 Tax=Uranotaenia lowii TaxID=190385 RepID=UPI002479AD69|nr:uncharacterized protein LOC129747117 [Uranotaenia lowii]
MEKIKRVCEELSTRIPAWRYNEGKPNRRVTALKARSVLFGLLRRNEFRLIRIDQREIGNSVQEEGKSTQAQSRTPSNVAPRNTPVGRPAKERPEGRKATGNFSRKTTRTGGRKQKLE